MVVLNYNANALRIFYKRTVIEVSCVFGAFYKEAMDAIRSGKVRLPTVAEYEEQKRRAEEALKRGELLSSLPVLTPLPVFLPVVQWVSALEQPVALFFALIYVPAPEVPATQSAPQVIDIGGAEVAAAISSNQPSTPSTPTDDVYSTPPSSSRTGEMSAHSSEPTGDT